MENITRILEALEFTVEPLSPYALRVTAPDHRTDMTGTHDLIEEIVRIYGLDRMPLTALHDEMPPLRGNPSLEFEERVRDLLVNIGLNEVVALFHDHVAGRGEVAAR